MDFDNALTIADDHRAEEIEAVDQALDKLGRHDPEAAQFVRLRFFTGLGHQEASQVIRLSRREADRLWALARAWLYREIADR